MKNVKWLSVALMVLWLALENCPAQTGNVGTSGGPVSGSDQQVQATDLVGKRGQQAVDLFTGSFGYSIPISCAPARNSSEPHLALVYSSAGENNWCGMGWKLDIGSIERNTLDGIPVAYSTGTTPAPLTQYDDTKGFMLNLSGKGYKLFSVATNGSTIEFRAEVDTDFLRCFCDTNSNNWTVYDKGGNAYFFGETTNSRVANPKSNWSGYSGTFYWALDQIVTVTGDWTTVAYTNNTSPYTGLPERTLYPTQITYNGHTNFDGYSANFAGPNKIIFQAEVRTNDWHFSYRSGFRTEQNRRLTNILCQVGSQNVWSYNLKYGISPATARSLLTNMVTYGYDANNSASAFSTNAFAYQVNPNAVSFGPTIRWTNMVLNTPDTSSGSYEPAVSEINLLSGFNYTVADLIDMDGDGLPDRVNYDNSTAPNQYLVQKNLGRQGGNGGFGSRYTFGPTSTGSGSVATNSNPFPNGSGYAQLNTPYGRIRDLNGDGLPDRVMDYWWAMNSGASGSLPYVPFTNYVVQLNTGQGFSGATNWPVSTGPLPLNNANAGFYYCVESGGINVGLLDMNGDGLPDRLMSGWYQQGAMTNFMVQFNTGTNFTPQRIFGPYHSQNYNATAQTLQYNWAGIETPEAHMIDINGDGLPDRLMYPMNPSSPGNELHPTTYYAVEYNDGYSFESTNTSTGAAGAADQWSGGSGLETVNGGSPADSIDNLPYVGLFDVNGDGLPDRVMVNWAADTGTTTSWLVFLNNGHGFSSSPLVVSNIENQGQNSQSFTPVWWSMQGSASGYGNVTTLMDIDGDGLLDRVMTVYDNGFNNANSTSNYFLVQLNTGPFPDLLTNINNGIGGNLGVTYNTSAAYDNRVDPTNPNSVSHMPFPHQVTATITANDGINPSQTTTYGYAGGYYDGPRREFHGFAVESTTDPTLRTTVTYFHTGGGRNYSALGEYQDTNAVAGNFAKAGMPYRVETYGNDNALYHVQINQVDQTSLGSGRYFPFTTLTFECDYPGNGTPKITAADFTYDTSTGNLTNKIDYGQVTGFNPTNTGSFSFTDADSSDTKYRIIHYASIGSNSYILDHPDDVSLTDGSNNIVQEIKYNYNSSSGTIANKLTEISSGYYATNTYGNYTSYGLVGTITDALGVQTTFTYDSIYNAYPATITVGSLITTSSYYARSGLLAASTDPAGITISNNFDFFQRPTESDIIPVGGGSPVWMKKFTYPATLQPISAGMAANYTDTIINDGVGGFTNRTYIDGFGRPVQTRTQGENGNFRVISTAYDGRGEAFLTTWPSFGTGVAFSKPATQTASWIGYDADGRTATNRLVTATFNASGAFSSKTDLSGDTGSPLAARTWNYANGTDPWWVIATDEDGKVRRYGLDAFGRTNQIQEVDGVNTYTTTLKYDLANNLTNISNANSENIYYAFDNAGSMVAMADPYLGQWTYQRDYVGRPRVQTDGRGDVIKLSYVNQSTAQQDPLGRVQTKEIYSTNYTSHGLTPIFTNTYVYDSSDDGNYTVYPGLLYKTTDSEGWQKNGYDTRGRLVKATRHLNIINQDYTIGYTYNDGDKIASVVYPNGGPVITNTYFHGGSLNQVSRNGSGYNFYTISAVNYDEFGHATNYTYGNGATTTHGYYSISKRLQSISSSATTNSVFSRIFTYTPGEDIASLGGTGLTNTASMTYDNLHRLKTYTGLAGSYGYDAVGNITNNIEGGGSAYGYGVRRPAAVRTAYGATNLYDLCGNMIVRHTNGTNSQSLVYDAENRLMRVATVNSNFTLAKFGYGGDDARLWKWSNLATNPLQVWIGNIYEEKDGKVLFHVYAGGEQVCTFENGSPLAGGTDTNKVGYYYHQDQLTSSSVLTDSSGKQAEVNAYYPFGRTLTASPQANFKVSRQFTGQIEDDETGLYYYNARYYDPELGRFIQADTVIPDFSNPQSYNRYSYVLNNPLRYNDPSGHRPLTKAEKAAIKKLRALEAATRALHKEFADSIDAFIKDFSKRVAAVPDNQMDPANLAIVSSAIVIWNSNNDKYNRERGKEQDTPIEGLTTLSKNNSTTCNYFVAETIWNGTGEFLGKRSWSGNVWPPTANAYATLKDGRLSNFSKASTTDMGDILAFPEPDDHGHVGVALGYGIYVSARTGDVPGSTGKNPVQPFSGVQVKDVPKDEPHITLHHN